MLVQLMEVQVVEVEMLVVHHGGAGNTPSTAPSQGNNGGTGQ
jgi:hypothetical protein